MLSKITKATIVVQRQTKCNGKGAGLHWVLSLVFWTAHLGISISITFYSFRVHAQKFTGGTK